jgi:hypothetical protein
VPLLHTHQRRKQLGWWLHATSASGRRAPATEHIWMLKSTLLRRWVSPSACLLDESNTARSATQLHAAPADEVTGLYAMHLSRAPYEYDYPNPADRACAATRCISITLYRESRAIRKAYLKLRLSFLANYIQTMLNFSLNYY